MEATPLKRGRGRPRGTGKADGPTLRRIADLIKADPTLRPTTAIKRTVGTQNPSTIRRLQVKWKAGHVALLDEARRRSESRRATMNPRLYTALARQLLGVPQAQRALDQISAALRVPSLKDLMGPPRRETI